MPWLEVTPVSQRQNFVRLAAQSGISLSRLCQRFNISRKTGYKWLRRYSECPTDLSDRSRRPRHSPRQTSTRIEQAVLKVRQTHPTWGGRKIRARLMALSTPEIPAASTITAILRRYQQITPQESAKHRAFISFEAQAPNDLWQMDFKGHFAISAGRCHPLTVLDDHSRYGVGLFACPDEKGLRVRAHLIDLFRRYGLPKRMLMDNGSPWGQDREHPYTPLTVWLIRLGIGICHGRAYHPQTQGKVERFHRTLKAEVTPYCQTLDLAQCQYRFNDWLTQYNWERPHEALQLGVPGQHYGSSVRSYPERLPEIDYDPADVVRKVYPEGYFCFRGCQYRVGRAFNGENVAIRPQPTDGLFTVHYCDQLIAELDLR